MLKPTSSELCHELMPKSTRYKFVCWGEAYETFVNVYDIATDPVINPDALFYIVIGEDCICLGKSAKDLRGMTTIVLTKKRKKFKYEDYSSIYALLIDFVPYLHK